MPLDPRTPVLVGAATASQRTERVGDGVEAAALMASALRGAADDAGAASLVDRVDEVLVPEGTWSYTDPGRLVGAPARARTVRAEIGVLQQTLLTRACERIASGDVAVVAVCGGEAKHRALQASIAGEEAPETSQEGVHPDEVMRPEAEILPDIEISRELAWPVRQYAVMESALRRREGVSAEEADRRLHQLWARFAAVAAANPDAWDRSGPGAAELAAAPCLSTPYTKRHASQWNVDQAAALLLCSAETAEALGVSRDRWIFPHVGVESNHMVPLSERAELDRCVAMAACADAVARTTGRDVPSIEHLDLYSCFPLAVRLQCREMGIDERADLTVTGGMTFAGGPLNNYVLGALVAMARELRADPGSHGLVSSVSGMLTKYGLGVWSTDPPADAFAAVDVSAEVAAATPLVTVDPDLAGVATVVGATVACERGTPEVAIVLADAPDGRRAVATSRRPEVLDALVGGDGVGREVAVSGPDVELV